MLEQRKRNTPQKSILTFAVLALLFVIGASAIASCSPATPPPAPTTDTGAISTQAAQTVVADLTKNAPPAPTPAPAATAAATEAPPAPGPTPDPNIPVAVFPTPAAGEPGAIANYNTAIFSGPGTNYVVLGALLGGKTIKVTGKNDAGTWWAVALGAVPTGAAWVDAAWVTVANADSVPVVAAPPVPPTTDLVPPAQGDPQGIAIANTYVRNGPGQEFPAYGIIPAGVLGRIVGVSEDRQWWVVRLNPEHVGAGYGWVMTAYIQASNVDKVQVVANPNSSTQAPPPPPAAGAPSVTAIDAVNLRSGPGENYYVLAVAPAGAAGEVSGKSSDGGWWQVKVSTNISSTGFAWVSASYVVTSNVDSVPVVEAPPPPETVPGTPPPASTTYGCQLVSQTPVDNTTFTIGQPFTTTWVLKNTGTTDWAAGEYDIAFVGAYNNVWLHTGPDRYDVATTVKPGQTYNFTVDMLAPQGAGQFGEGWHVIFAEKTVCPFYVYITVP